MSSYAVGRKEPLYTYLAIIILAAVTAALTWLSPSEETLGSVVKLVYLHLAVAWTGLLFFLITSVLGLVGLIVGGKWIRWSLATQRTSLIVWATYLASSFAVSYLAWGGMNWTEPRLRIGLTILWMALLSVIITLITSAPKVIGATNLLLGVASISLWATRYNVLHPGNPIGDSNSLTIKLYSNLILVALFGMAVFVARALALASKKES